MNDLIARLKNINLAGIIVVTMVSIWLFKFIRKDIYEFLSSEIREFKENRRLKKERLLERFMKSADRFYRRGYIYEAILFYEKSLKLSEDLYGKENEIAAEILRRVDEVQEIREKVEEEMEEEGLI